MVSSLQLICCTTFVFVFPLLHRCFGLKPSHIWALHSCFAFWAFWCTMLEHIEGWLGCRPKRSGGPLTPSCCSTFKTAHVMPIESSQLHIVCAWSVNACSPAFLLYCIKKDMHYCCAIKSCPNERGKYKRFFISHANEWEKWILSNLCGNAGVLLSNHGLYCKRHDGRGMHNCNSGGQWRSIEGWLVVLAGRFNRRLTRLLEHAGPERAVLGSR